MLARIELLIDLCHHRWAVRVLAALHENPALGRVAPLARRLGVGRSTLRQTLDALGALGLVRENPGYGHPLRPEVLLTGRGRAVGAWSVRIVRAVRRRAIEDVAFRKWSLPVLHAVGSGRDRFSELESALAGVTARALALTLTDLGAAGLLTRTVLDARPPRARYGVPPAIRRFVSLVADLPAV